MRKRKKRLNRSGFTLIEVIVAITILLLAAEIVSLSVTFNARMNTRSQEIYHANAELGKKMLDETAGSKAEFSMAIGGDNGIVTGKGRMYAEAANSSGSGMEVYALQAGDDVLGDLFKRSDENAGTLSTKPEVKGLPDVFPKLGPDDPIGEGEGDRDLDLINPYFSEGVFHNGDPSSTELNTYAILDTQNEEGNWEGELVIDASGAYTAAGVTTLRIMDFSLSAEKISVWLGAEVYCLSGTLLASYPKQTDGKIPVHLYLVPESGHGQPALVFADSAFVSVTIDGVEDSKLSYEIPNGWYAIPSGTTGDAKDLFKMTLDDWKMYHLTEENENAAESKIGKGAIDKAYARLILAGIIDPNGVEEEEP